METELPPPTTKTPPGPDAAGMEQARAAGFSPAQFLTHLVERYGDAVHYRNPYNDVYFFNHPDQVQLIAQGNQFHRERLMTLVLGYGLLSSDGDYWRGQRRLMAPLFHERCMPAFAPLIVETTLEAFGRWDDLQQMGRPLDVAFEMRRLTLDVVLRSFFSVRLGARLNELGDAVTTLIEDLGAITNTLFNVRERIDPERNARFQAALRLVDNFAYGAIAERRAQSERPRDLLTVLLGGKDETTGQPLDDKQLRDEVLTMLIAGHETTAIALAWALYLIATHPEAAQRLDAELDSVLGGRTPTAAEVPALLYTRMVLEEAMRLNPPVWFTMRRALVATTIGGYDVPAGASVLVSAFTTQRHRDFWPNPEAFKPERFSPEQSRGRPKYAHFPFSGGRHHCLGHLFATMEGQIILAMMTQQWHVRPRPGHVVDSNPALTLRQRTGFLATMERREAPRSP